MSAFEHKRLNRYDTMTLDEICALPVVGMATSQAITSSTELIAGLSVILDAVPFRAHQ